MVTARDAGHTPTEFKNIVLSYPSITYIMVDSQCEILWADNSGADLGSHPTENYASGLDYAEKQAIFSQKRLMSKMLGIWIKKSLYTDAKRKLKYFKSSYNFKYQDDRSAIFFVIVKIVRPDTCVGCSGIKSNLDNMKISHFKHGIPKSKLHIL